MFKKCSQFYIHVLVKLSLVRPNSILFFLHFYSFPYFNKYVFICLVDLCTSSDDDRLLLKYVVQNKK
jgi:hypothetical protein